MRQAVGEQSITITSHQPGQRCPPGPVQMFPGALPSPQPFPAGMDPIALKSAADVQGYAARADSPGEEPGSQGCDSGTAPVTGGKGKAVYYVCAGVQVANAGKQLSPEQEGRAGGCGVGCHPCLTATLRVPIPLDYCRTQPGSSRTLPCSPNVPSVSFAQGTPECKRGNGHVSVPPHLC